MSAIADELNLNEISSDLIKKELIKIAKRRLNSDNVKISIERGSKKGDNFVGLIYRILYKDANETSDKNQSSLILKIAPTDEFRREKQKLRELFLREISIYDEVLSFFYNFQLSKGVIPGESGLNEYPNCYSSISEELSESLFFEDLTARNFDVINIREEVLTFDHVSLLMNALGKFHAISFALKDQQPDKFKELTKLVSERYWKTIQSELKNHVLQMFDRFTACVKRENRIDSLEKFNKTHKSDYHATVNKLISGEAAEPYAVICHGDLTTYNSLFRKDENGKPIEIQLIDWQFPRYASPITDLVLYLFCSTSKELRDKHYNDFLKIYHNSLSDLLARLGSDPQKLFPYKALLEQIQQFGSYALIVGSILVPILCVEVDSLPGYVDVAELEEKNIPMSDEMFRIPDKSKKDYDRRVTDLFDDLARIGCF